MSRKQKGRLAAAVAVAMALALAGKAGAVAPTVLGTTLSGVTGQSVVFEGELNPGERVTKYRFEYGLADCAANPCQRVPAEGEGDTVPKGGVPVAVSAEAGGLAAGTTYHFRLVAENPEGEDASEDRTFATYLPPPVFGSCSNDPLRLENPMKAFIDYSSSNLPDCRAYEQASPVDKNGIDIRGVAAWVKASPEGERFSFLTGVGIPGAEGLQAEIPAWIASKEASGWSTRGIFAPAGAGEVVQVIGWDRDLSLVFQQVRREGPPLEGALLARSSADGSLSEVVPYHPFVGDPFYAYAGSSEDGSTVLLESNEALDPHAVAGKPNLYAWNPDTETMRLASVLPEEEAKCAEAPCSPPLGAFAGAYAWMRQAKAASEGDPVTLEGGARAGNYNQDLHALSDDGRRLYFSAAATGQLYLRTNPGELQSPTDSEGNCTDPQLACTVRVSASHKENGKGEGGRDAAGPRPAAFLAASADGSVAYFSSAEKLTDDAYTGPEPEAPSIARAKQDGEGRQLKFLESRTAKGLATGGEYLYWADPVKGTVGRAKLNGEGAATEIEPEYVTRAQLEVPREVENEESEETETLGFAEPSYVAVSADHVYWTNATTEADGEGTVGRAKLGPAGAEEAQPEYIGGASNPRGIALGPCHDEEGNEEAGECVYWANDGSEVATRTLGRAKIGPSEAEEVVQSFIAIDFGLQANHPQGVAVDATHIYLAVIGEGGGFNVYVVRFDLSSKASSERFVFLDNTKPGTRGVALDPTYLYWAHEGGDAVGRIPLADFALDTDCALIPSCEPEFIHPAGHPVGLAGDGERLYWSAEQSVAPNPGNDLYRWEAEGGELKDLTALEGEDAPFGAEAKGVAGASQDGSVLYLVANGALAGGAEAGDCAGLVSNAGVGFGGECSLYRYREGAEPELEYLARLAGADAEDWLAAAPIDSLRKTSRTSADGETLIFVSRRRLGPYDNEGVPELYRYRAGEGTGCISCNPTGAPPSGPVRLGSIAPTFLVPSSLPGSALSRNLSVDGDRVFFESTDPLVGTDVNGTGGCPEKGNERFAFPSCRDAYEWEAKGTGSCESEAQNGGCLYLLSSGKSEDASFFGDASADGGEAFVFTRAKLVGQDQDQLYDAYDASVNGGLDSQNQAPFPKCESSEACHEEGEAQPELPTPASESFRGEGNPKPHKRRCPKGKRRVRRKGKVRCAKKRHRKHRHRKHRRHARPTARAGR